MKITVIGTGYLGATHAAAMAELGHEVLGMDTDTHKVEALNKGQAPFVERGLDDLLAKHTASGLLRFTSSYAEAADFADVHFLGIGTPQQSDSGAYDLTHLHAAVRQLAPRLRDHALIVGKSTVPVGTTTQLRQILNARTSHRIHLAWSPEFLRESFAVEDTLRPDRIVLGVEDGDTTSETVFRAVYAEILGAGSPLIVTDLPTAELIKGAANAFLATKISFINAMAELCELTGADVQQLALGLGYDQRIGFKGMRPGLGFGGGCLPKDLLGFTHRAEELGADQVVTFLRQVDAINRHRRERTVQLAREQLGGTVTGQRIAVWGAAFKPGTDDIRDSPALAVADALHRAGAEVTVHDPAAIENARRAYPALDYADDAASAVTGAALLLHLTDWPQYGQTDPADLRQHIAVPRVIDARGTLDTDRWRAAGWTVRALGRP